MKFHDNRIVRSSFALLLILACASMSVAAGEKPNILIILMDDFGTGQFQPIARQLELEDIDPGLLAYTDSLNEPYDKQAALDAARQAMPFMSDLAGQGVLFSRAFSANSLCAPSRQAILTGSNPIRRGGYRNIDVEASGLQGRSLAPRLQEAGYRTGFIGKWHMGEWDASLLAAIEAKGGSAEDAVVAGYEGSASERDHPLNNGFDYSFFYNRWECPFYNSTLIWENRSFTGLQEEYNTDLFTRKAMDFMAAALDDGKPFLAQVAFHTSHLPLDVDAPDIYASRFNSGNRDIDRFYSHIYGADQSVKKMVDLLKARGAWDNTILFFMSDNGATAKVGDGDLSLIPGNGFHRGHKGQYFLGGIRVPLLMTWPARVGDARHIDANVSLMDVMPTALAAAGIEVPAGLDGRSLLPLVDGTVDSLHDELYFAGIHAFAWGYSGKDVLGNAKARRDESPGAWAMVEGDYILRFIGTLDAGLDRTNPEGRPAFVSLHNLRDDPLEQVDLAGLEPQRLEQMKRKYFAFARQLPPPHQWDRKRWEELVTDPSTTKQNP